MLAEDAVIVTDYDEFANALSSGKKNIVVEGSFTIRDDKLTETDGSIKGQMKPVQIPGGTTITGNGTGSITCSHPIQIMGDDVEIRDIQLVFNSSNGLGSVPHLLPAPTLLPFAYSRSLPEPVCRKAAVPQP